MSPFAYMIIGIVGLKLSYNGVNGRTNHLFKRMQQQFSKAVVPNWWSGDIFQVVVQDTLISLKFVQINLRFLLLLVTSISVVVTCH